MDHMSGLHRFFWLEKVPLENFWDVSHNKQLSKESFDHGPYNYQDWLTYLQLRAGKGLQGPDGTSASTRSSRISEGSAASPGPTTASAARTTAGSSAMRASA